MMTRRGVTLSELLMVVVLIGILATAAVPQYGRAVQRGYRQSAQDVLRTIYAGQQVYFTENDQFLDAPSTLAQWRLIYMDNPNVSSPMPVTFTVAAAGTGAAATMTATASHTGGGRTMTINETGVLNLAGWAQP